MTQLTRIIGLLMMISGGLVILTWLIEPLRQFWPVLLALPTPIKIGLAIAAVGVLLLVGSLLWERWQEREHDRSLLED